MMKKVLIIVALIFILFTDAYGQSVDELLKEAEYLKKQGHNNSAIAVYHRARKQDPKNLEVIRAFADFMVEVRNYAYAIKLFRDYLEINPGDIGIREIIIDIYTSLDQYEDAINETKELLKRDPDNYEVLSKLKVLYQKTQRLHNEAIITEKMLKLKPDDKATSINLIKIYNSLGKYKKAAKLLDEKMPIEEISPVTIGHIYLQAERYDRAIEIFQENYEKNPTEDNQGLIRKAELAKINNRLERSPRAFNAYFSPMNRMIKRYPNDPEIRELSGRIRKEVQGFYTGYEYAGGKSGENEYYNHFGAISYPILSTGTQVKVTGQDYHIKNSKYSEKYRQTGLELHQSLGSGFSLSGGYSSGDPGDTYYGQLYYEGERFQGAVIGRKDYQIQTPEALRKEIHYNMFHSFLSWSVIDRLSLFGRYAKQDLSDDNSGTYTEIGAFYQLWNNRKNATFDIALLNSNQKYDFESNYYYSPKDLTQWHAFGEFSYYWTKNSLIKVSYQHTWEKDGNKYDIYHGYIDHQFSKDFFLYGEYFSGLSTMGKVGVGEDPNSHDHEFKMGLKVKF